MNSKAQATGFAWFFGLIAILFILIIFGILGGISSFFNGKPSVDTSSDSVFRNLENIRYLDYYLFSNESEVNQGVRASYSLFFEGGTSPENNQNIRNYFWNVFVSQNYVKGYCHFLKISLPREPRIEIGKSAANENIDIRSTPGKISIYGTYPLTFYFLNNTIGESELLLRMVIQEDCK